MSGNEIQHLKGIKSGVIEFILKPCLIAGCVLAYPVFMWISPPKQIPTQQIPEAAIEAAREAWNDDKKTHFKPVFGVWIIAVIVACALEADNAYMQFFLRFTKIYAKKRGFFHD